MPVRILKIILVAWIALLCLVYATQNIANLDQAYAAVQYVFSMDEHVVYPGAFGPAITHPLLIGFALAVIIALEYTAGVLAAKGAWDLWRARQSAADFNAAKTFAILGAGTAMIVWLGLFSVIGGAYFQMWQTAAGAASLEGAFQFLGMSAFVLLFVNMKDD